MSTFQKHFGSLHAMITVPFRRHANKSAWEDYLRRYRENAASSDRWLGCSVGEAEKRVAHGWADGAKQVVSRLGDIEVPMPVSVKRRLVRGEQGDELDIHSVYRGDLGHAWSARRRKHIRNPLSVRIVVQCNLLSETRFYELFWRGAAAVKLADLLTAAGYNVEILGTVASSTVQGYPSDFLLTFPLKEANAPLDVEMLAGVVCNAGFHRVFGFRAYGALTDLRHSPGDASSDKTGRILSEMVEKDGHGAPSFITPYGIFNKDGAERWIRGMVQQLDTTHDDA